MVVTNIEAENCECGPKQYLWEKDLKNAWIDIKDTSRSALLILLIVHVVLILII